MAGVSDPTTDEIGRAAQHDGTRPLAVASSGKRERDVEEEERGAKRPKRAPCGECAVLEQENRDLENQLSAAINDLTRKAEEYDRLETEYNVFKMLLRDFADEVSAGFGFPRAFCARERPCCVSFPRARESR